MAYTEAHHYRAANLYYQNGGNLSKIAKMPDMPSRPTLHEWKKSGLPTELTGGKDWDDWSNDKKQEQIAQRKAEDSALYVEENKEFLERAKVQFKQAFDHIYDQIMYSDNVDVQPKDLKTLMEMYLVLDNQAADKVEFMENFANLVLQAAIDIMDEHQFTQLRSKLLTLKKREKDKLGIIPNDEPLQIQ